MIISPQIKRLKEHSTLHSNNYNNNHENTNSQAGLNFYELLIVD